MDVALEKVYRMCKPCKQLAPTDSRPVVASNVSFTEPGPIVSLDFKERKVGKYRYILYGVDVYSSLVFAVFLKDKSTETVVDKIMTIYAASGTCIPRRFYMDGGKEFCSESFREMCEMLGVECLTTDPYSPWSNGKVEKFMQWWIISMKR